MRKKDEEALRRLEAAVEDLTEAVDDGVTRLEDENKELRASMEACADLLRGGAQGPSVSKARTLLLKALAGDNWRDSKTH